MAIDKGIAIDCADLVEVGGVRNIYVTEISNIVDVDEGSAGTHEYTKLTNTTTPSAVPYAMFAVKPNSASWNTTATKEAGLTSYETTLSWYIPNITSLKLHELMNMENACIVAVAEFRSGERLVIGMSSAYKNTGYDSTGGAAAGANDKWWLYTKHYASMTLEGVSGAAAQDGNGVTVTLTAKSYEIPRVYSGAVTPVAGGITATLA
jgi:hypothetical protein